MDTAHDSNSYSSTTSRNDVAAEGTPAGAIPFPAGGFSAPAGSAISSGATSPDASVSPMTSTSPVSSTTSASKRLIIPPSPAMAVEMGVLEDHNHSDTSSATGSISQPELDVNFNAAVYHTLKQKIFERTFVVAAQLAQLAYLTWRWYYF